MELEYQVMLYSGNPNDTFRTVGKLFFADTAFETLKHTSTRFSSIGKVINGISKAEELVDKAFKSLNKEGRNFKLNSSRLGSKNDYSFLVIASKRSEKIVSIDDLDYSPIESHLLLGLPTMKKHYAAWEAFSKYCNHHGILTDRKRIFKKDYENKVYECMRFEFHQLIE